MNLKTDSALWNEKDLNEMPQEREKSTTVCRQPRRYRLALLTFVALLAPVYFVPPVVTAVIDGPRIVTVPVMVAAIVVLMSYAIMPLLTRVFDRWLFAQDKLNTNELVQSGLFGAYNPKRQTR